MRARGVFTLCSALAALAPLAASPVRAATDESTITPQELATHVRWLADDAREGRGLGTGGLAESAAYIERELVRLGLEGAAPGGGFRQAFDLERAGALGPGSDLMIRRSRLRAGDDYAALPWSDSGRASGSLVVCAGAPDARVSRAIAVLLPAASLELGVRVEAAARNGAAGVLAISEQVSELPGGWRLGGGPSLPAVSVWRAAFLDALGDARERFEKAESDTRAAADGGPVALDGVAATVKVESGRTTITAENILAMLPGADPACADSAVILGAHYDHLGIAGEGDGAVVMNGADDNAAGVAALLEIAETMAAVPAAARARRPVLFAFFSAEEEGRLGSEAFIRSCARPLPWLAMLNLDTPGRPERGTVQVFGTGSAAELGELVASAPREPGFGVAPIAASMPSSDDWSFVQAGVPALHVFGSAHADYHRATDDADKVDYDALARTTRWVRALACSLAARTGPLTTGANLDGSAPGAERPAASPSGERPWLGTVPDFTFTGPGVRLSGVSPGSPAERAGLAAGDILLELGGTPADDLATFSRILREHAVGDELDILVRRGAQEIRALVTLARRP